MSKLYCFITKNVSNEGESQIENLKKETVQGNPKKKQINSISISYFNFKLTLQ